MCRADYSQVMKEADGQPVCNVTAKCPSVPATAKDYKGIYLPWLREDGCARAAAMCVQAVHHMTPVC
jgi:hypothetical protein